MTRSPKRGVWGFLLQVKLFACFCKWWMQRHYSLSEHQGDILYQEEMLKPDCCQHYDLHRVNVAVGTSVQCGLIKSSGQRLGVKYRDPLCDACGAQVHVCVHAFTVSLHWTSYFRNLSFSITLSPLSHFLSLTFSLSSSLSLPHHLHNTLSYFKTDVHFHWADSLCCSFSSLVPFLLLSVYPKKVNVVFFLTKNNQGMLSLSLLYFPWCL